MDGHIAAYSFRRPERGYIKLMAPFHGDPFIVITVA